MSETLKFITRTRGGTLVKMPVQIERARGRIEFLDAPFALKDEIKSMQGSKWHGYDDTNPRQIWSVKDCDRNWFQIRWLTGENPYEPWEREIIKHVYDRPLRTHQCLMTDIMLTYHYCVIAAEMGLGKSLSGIECMEKSGFTNWWWAAPKSGLAAIEREFKKWNSAFLPRLLTYDRLRIEMEQWEPGQPPPRGVLLDESSRLKGGDAKRTKAAMELANAIRREYGDDGYCILMSGSPSPKSPLDWWSQIEIAAPGFLKEGSPKAFEWRLAVFTKQKTEQGDFFKRVTWKDDPAKCNVCGKLQEEHADELFGGEHKFVPCVDEVSLLKERLNGVVWSFSKEEWLKELPDMIFREVKLEPTSTLKRVAKALAGAAPTAIQGLTWLRELSDGFQYKEVQNGTNECPCCHGVGEVEAWEIDGEINYTGFDEAIREGAPIKQIIAPCDVCKGELVVPNMVRETKQVPCPKDEAIKDLLDENDEQGRIVIFAGFQGSIDRVTKLCLDEKWDVVQVDGRGWRIFLPDGSQVRGDVLDHWADRDNRRVAFVAHPASGGMGLTLVESRMAVFYSNDFSPESRTQAMARIHRMGMDTNKGATIVDLLHLPTDEKVLRVLQDNRRLEKMTLQEFRGMLE
jgi:hypothetical protein